MTTETSPASTPVRRQAIVIIHGIGEQRPLGTLKAFVRSFRPTSTFYSKPERLTSSFEARRIKLRRLKDCEVKDGEDWIETDFFEYYWAHLMFEERWRHFVFWACRVLRRVWLAGGTATSDGPRATGNESVYHARILGARPWLLGSLSVLLTVTAVALAFFGMGPVVLAAIGAFVLAALVDWGSQSVVLRVVGDVSRYLDVSPQNIARRHAILGGGIELLHALHSERSDLAVGKPGSASGEPLSAPYVYDRVVVVGHSLGSVIAYDLIKHYWARVNRYLTFTEDSVPLSLTNLEGLPSERGSAAPPEAFQEFQFALWRDLGRSRDLDRSKEAESPKGGETLAPPRWLITDFVTLGSPLTYAPILLSESASDFSEQTRLRELPICPPDRSKTDRKGKFAVHLFYEAAGYEDDPREPLIVHHAAPFALTRWTNFFFSQDPIGGPLQNVFGCGVRDVPVKPEEICFDAWAWPRSLFNGLRLHTRYWPQSHHIPKLLAILKWPSDRDARSSTVCDRPAVHR